MYESLMYILIVIQCCVSIQLLQTLFNINTNYKYTLYIVLKANIRGRINTCIRGCVSSN